jgi:hypothetical protein
MISFLMFLAASSGPPPVLTVIPLNVDRDFTCLAVTGKQISRTTDEKEVWRLRSVFSYYLGRITGRRADLKALEDQFTEANPTLLTDQILVECSGLAAAAARGITVRKD